MAQAKSDYPRDEFDAFSAVAGGAHRGKKTILARVMPFIIAMIVAALCALAFLTWTNDWLGENGLNISPSTTTSKKVASAKKSASKDTTSKKDADAQSEKSEKTTEDSSSNSSESQNSQQDQQAQQQPAAQADKSKAVYIYNGTGVSGLAATKAQTLKNAGYTNVTPANPSGTGLPSANTVWYVNDADKATADDIAAQLGISAVQKVSGLSNGDIAVVIMQQ
ncbi:LytR C-terminal domain-containing protein [Alloscardovia omnicolens]|uniref:LytR/CpsA/Psr regulator C-terminal domain-containing protein n=2 Tax=Actinomycetes TaxID=1760 RepID=U1QU19_9BIFI|nr:LytR C-terminal domain-containing protein [Alloscardovia omnicolens]ERH30900.1 hypothetical protein HMPREF9244_00848 [Alloscardovia omnicolens F0580]KWZ74578.1 hypothetical protein HMPREF3214_00691 [Alloscardovia omnicolens]MDK6444755.1 LytR C-terminal domain-containing protein [Alloscardovia omnicolens]MDK6642879.1 LytR C-terminal domain-containing protein [Alloscardovia omnicolens]MDK8081162.1 LytR C-terminal domain-containing protein [Alloscardovia omnicolens]